ncbi:MAG: tRNA dihydrouridine(20/20a) synthase DusA [Spirochaetales bacterium]
MNEQHLRPHRPVLSIAPMMDCTDRHYRYFMRLITSRTLLYTEMISTGAIVHGDRSWLLDFDPSERPLALQIGGSDIDEIARATEIADAWPYDEINLNVGCPSDRVQERGLGACLMLTPERVRDMVSAMRTRTSKPVTVKHRIGVDEMNRYEDLLHFVQTVREAGPARFTVHARIAWLKGLSPKDNRNIPPIRYEDVYRLKRDCPELDIEINGHIKTLSEARDHLDYVDAVMMGRAAYDSPWVFSAADAFLSEHAKEQGADGAGLPPGAAGLSGASRLPSGAAGLSSGAAGLYPAADRFESTCRTRGEVIERMVPYFDYWLRRGTPGRKIARHMLGLFAGMPGAKAWKQALSGKLPDDCGPILRRMRAELPRESILAPRQAVSPRIMPDAERAG